MHPTNPYDLWRVDSFADHYLDVEVALSKTTFDSDPASALA